MNSKQFLKEGFLEDAHEAHSDHEVQMARVDCYYAAEHAIVLHKLLRNISEEQGLEGWVASKITLANDYLKSVREHLEYQMMNVDAGEDDFLPLAEGLKPVKKNSVAESTAPVAEDEEEKFQDFERGPWYVIVKGNPVSVDGVPKKFNWLNGAKTYFRSMMDKNPEMAQKIKREYDEASDKKSVIYYTKNLPANNTTSTEQPVSESEKPGLWANIRAKRKRIKGGSGERMRKPGSKGAPSDKDLKSIRAASESTVNESDFHSQFAAMIDDMKKSGQLKTGGPTKSQAKYAPEPSRAELEARLRELESEFDPEYQYSDDYSFWTKQNAIAREIASIKKKLGSQGVAESNLEEIDRRGFLKGVGAAAVAGAGGYFAGRRSVLEERIAFALGGCEEILSSGKLTNSVITNPRFQVLFDKYNWWSKRLDKKLRTTEDYAWGKRRARSEIEILFIGARRAPIERTEEEERKMLLLLLLLFLCIFVIALLF